MLSQTSWWHFHFQVPPKQLHYPAERKSLKWCFFISLSPMVLFCWQSLTPLQNLFLCDFLLVNLSLLSPAIVYFLVFLFSSKGFLVLKTPRLQPQSSWRKFIFLWRHCMNLIGEALFVFNELLIQTQYSAPWAEGVGRQSTLNNSVNIQWDHRPE